MLSGVGLLLYQRTVYTTPAPIIQKQTQTPSIISGSFDINGIIPANSTIKLTKRELSTSTPQTARKDILPEDEGLWSINDTYPGKSYELVAQIIQNNQIIATSAPLTVTAPASKVVLSINIEDPQLTEQAVISGIIRVNGYIPPNATLSVLGRKLGETKFQPIIQHISAEPRQIMNYTTATAGQTYEVYGILYDQSNKLVGTSQVLVLTAPALNEALTVNSQALVPSPTGITNTPTIAPSQTQQTSPTKAPSATPTPTPISLSGNITFNGIAPLNSRIVIFQKPYTTQNYQVAVDNITPVDGTTWTWTGATAGRWYDIIAVLKQKQSDGTDKDLATSQSLSAAAPAKGITFTINSSVSLSAPSGSISVACNSLSGNTWTATVSFESITGAQTYWYQIGTSNGGTETANNVLNPKSGQNTQTVSLSLSKGTSYYVRYAYATVANIPAGSTQFSPFSSTTQIQCN